jgi:hypothetical protein
LFSNGDLPTNGSGAQRLTDNTARDVFPRFSPDGKKSCSPDVYVDTTPTDFLSGHDRAEIK